MTATLSTEADVAALRAGTAAPGEISIEGRVLVDALSLGFLAEVAPEELYNVQGKLDIDASVRGTPDAPQFDGGPSSTRGRLRAGRADGTLHVNLDQMPAQSPGLPRLEITSKINAELEASSERARVDVSLAGTRVDVPTSSVEAAFESAQLAADSLER